MAILQVWNYMKGPSDYREGPSDYMEGPSWITP